MSVNFYGSLQVQSLREFFVSFSLIYVTDLLKFQVNLVGIGKEDSFYLLYGRVLGTYLLN